jgi:hypothetical protein
MNYWLTTHWPRPKSTPNSQPYADVWVKNGQLNVIKQLAPGDLVFIYESKSGSLPVGQNPDGSTYTLPKAQGRAGLVALVRVMKRAVELRRPHPSRIEIIARSRLLRRESPSDIARSNRDCSRLNQFPARTPNCLTPLTRRIPAASSGLDKPESAAS